MKTKHLITAGGAILAGAGAMVGLHLPFVVEGLIALAMAGGVGTSLALVQSGNQKLLAGPKADAALPAPTGQGGLSKEQLETIQKATTKITDIRNAATGVRSPNTARQIRRICDVGDKIVQDFRDDPSDITHARTWLDVYLDELLSLVQKYARLSQTGSRSLDAQRVLGEVEQTFQVIEVQSKELLDKLLHNDITGLDVDQRVIRQMLTSEKM